MRRNYSFYIRNFDKIAIQLNSSLVEKVWNFRYLGSPLIFTGHAIDEIPIWITGARGVFFLAKSL